MAKCAYEDKERTKLIYADDATNKDTIYYCPNKDCNAEMCLCSKEGIKVPYFRAFPRKGHVENCPYKNDVVPFIRSLFDESSFKYEDVMENILASDRQKKKEKEKEKENENERDAVELLYNYANSRGLDVQLNFDRKIKSEEKKDSNDTKSIDKSEKEKLKDQKENPEKKEEDHLAGLKRKEIIRKYTEIFNETWNRIKNEAD